MKHKLDSRLAGRNINNLRYADDTTLMAESEEALKSLLMKVKEESEKVSLKFNIQKTNIIASGPITSWQIDEETMETVTYFIFLGSKITEDGDCRRQGSRVSMRVARGSASLLPSHWRGIWPRDVLKKVSRGLSRVEAGNPGFPRLVQVTSGGFSWWL